MGGRGSGAAWLACLLVGVVAAAAHGGGGGGVGEQPLSRVAIHRARVALDASAAVRASPSLLGSQYV
uniref:Uncharacterized protein n=1 Tax=Leersia perrieri TaxID=77586 RepID=A0A0D9XFE5_9ORYZ